MPRAKAAGAAAGKKPRAPPKGAQHQLAEKIPPGEILTDTIKKTWCLGKAVGSGGFGLIYLASKGEDKSKEDYVIKVEPHSNGPLFCELSFYQRCAKPDTIKAWMDKKKMKCLGIPRYISSGLFERNGTRLRFMVMEKFGTDLQKLFEQNGKMFSRKTVLQLGSSLVDSLQYIHEQGYAHADIKGANLLLGFHKSNQNQVYLVDYGLAFRFSVDGKHKEYKEDPRRAHDGTIEFTSRDAHLGVNPSRRADFEILGYCLVQWLCSRLPWEDNLKNQDYVRDQKIKSMKNVPAFLKTCFGKLTPPEELQQYLAYVAHLDYEEEPDYNHLRSIFSKAARKQGFTLDGKIDLSAPSESSKKPAVKGGRKRKEIEEEQGAGDKVSSSEEDESPVKKVSRGKKVVKKEVKKEVKTEVKTEIITEIITEPSAKKVAKNASQVEKTLTPAKAVGNGIIPTRWQPASASKSSHAVVAAAPSSSKIIPGAPGAVASPAKGGRGRRSKENGCSTPTTSSDTEVLNGKVTKAKDRKNKLKCSSTVATQTSPGLRGLPRSWKKT